MQTTVTEDDQSLCTIPMPTEVEVRDHWLETSATGRSTLTPEQAGEAKC